jgi:hypothetical protein
MSMVMNFRMSENQACQGLWCLRVKPGKKGLNRRLRPVLQGGGLAGSHTLPNHVTEKRMVNTTLAKGYHAQIRYTARNFLCFTQ